MSFSNIQIGDTVAYEGLHTSRRSWVERWKIAYARIKVGKVIRVTPAQFVVEMNGQEYRFRKSDGAVIGDRLYGRCFFPEPDQIADIEAQQAKELRHQTVHSLINSLDSDLNHKRITFEEAEKLAAVYEEIKKSRQAEVKP